MKSYLSIIRVSLLVILASIGIGVTTTYPLTPSLFRDCLYNNYANDVYDSPSTLDSQFDDCLLKPMLIGAGVTFITSMSLLYLLRKHTAYKEVFKKFIPITGLLYGAMQLISILFLQSNYLTKNLQATTNPEILQSYWFAIDPVVYFLVASCISWAVVQRKRLQ